MNETGEAQGGSLFLQMVLTLQTSAMQHLGKIASPFTGEVERDVESAKAAIDMLVMLRDKTRGNLNEVESKILDRVVYECQMNYVDEAEKKDEQKEDKPETDKKDEGKEEEPKGEKEKDEKPEGAKSSDESDKNS